MHEQNCNSQVSQAIAPVRLIVAFANPAKGQDPKPEVPVF